MSVVADGRGDELLSLTSPVGVALVGVAPGGKTSEERGEATLEESWGLTMIWNPFIAATAT